MARSRTSVVRQLDGTIADADRLGVAASGFADWLRYRRSVIVAAIEAGDAEVIGHMSRSAPALRRILRDMADVLALAPPPPK